MRHVFGYSQYVEGEIAEQSAIELAKSYRNKLLLESDFSQMPDAPLSEEQRSSWRVYRQTLRDVTSQDGWPYIEVPSRPDGA